MPVSGTTRNYWELESCFFDSEVVGLDLVSSFGAKNGGKGVVVGVLIL